MVDTRLTVNIPPVNPANLIETRLTVYFLAKTLIKIGHWYASSAYSPTVEQGAVSYQKSKKR